MYRVPSICSAVTVRLKIASAASSAWPMTLISSARLGMTSDGSLISPVLVRMTVPSMTQMESANPVPVTLIVSVKLPSFAYAASGRVTYAVSSRISPLMTSVIPSGRMNYATHAAPVRLTGALFFSSRMPYRLAL